MDPDFPNDPPNPYAPSQHLPSAPPQHGETLLEPDDGRSPFWTIWFHPRQTVRRIVSRDPSLHVFLLASLGGIGEALERASMRNAGDEMPLFAVLAVVLVFGPIGGLLSLWIGSHLIRFSGDWMGGVGNRTFIMTAMAWGSVPAVFALPLWIPQLAFLGSDLFTEATPVLDAQPWLLIPFLAISLLEIVLGIWGFILLCNTIAEVQGYPSAWKGFANLFLAGMVLVIPMIFIVAIVIMVSSM